MDRGVDRPLAGEVIKLDRGYPLVQLKDGRTLRSEQATDLIKKKDQRVVIGDQVQVLVPEDHDKAIIVSIEPRKREFIRKDPTERTLPQVLAANFDRVIIAQPVTELNLKRLTRELVLAHETGAQVTIVLTKADLAEEEAQTLQALDQVKTLAGPDVGIEVLSYGQEETIESLRRLIQAGDMAILIGRSGVGKTSLINMLLGSDRLKTAEVRERDHKGRHTTVSREVVTLPGGGRIVDMPGVRGLGLWDADEGIDAAFPDIVDLAAHCRFRDCRHKDEPGCAVLAAVASGDLSAERLCLYQNLSDELSDRKKRREEARWAANEKFSSRSSGKTRTGTSGKTR